VAHCILWIEGLDLDETLFDTGMLSVIRGASRAYEEMPYAACARFAGAPVVALGASMVGLIVPGDAASVAAQAGPLFTLLAGNGVEPKEVEKALTDTAATNLSRYAPFAHLKFNHAIVEIAAPGGDAAIAAAIEAARAGVRLRQLREPGLRLRPKPDAGIPSQPCAFDGLRTAEVSVFAPPTPEDESRGATFSKVHVSRSSGARWQFGRALRQRLYADARARHEGRDKQPLAFVDDFQEMVQQEICGDDALPRLPQQGGTPADLPVSVTNKIAVFNADGDKFTALRGALKDALGVADGQQVFSLVLEHKMRSLLTALVDDLMLLRDHPDADARAAVSLVVGSTSGHGVPRTAVGLTPKHRLLRLETLLLGGDDTLFVVPSWLGWWLARRFFEITNGWTFDKDTLQAALHNNPFNPLPQVKIDALASRLQARRDPGKPDPFALRFSAGLVFADRKAPIRALKNLAQSLMYSAKRLGGLEVEVLESLEPPEGGLEALRNGQLGKAWKTNSSGSLLVIPREQVGAHYDALAHLWCGADPVPASPLHRALRAARRKAGGLSDPTAQETAKSSLSDSAKRSVGVTRFNAGDTSLWPGLGDALPALRLHGVLQQRDYVRASQPWMSMIAALSRPATGAQP